MPCSWSCEQSTSSCSLSLSTNFSKGSHGSGGFIREIPPFFDLIPVCRSAVLWTPFGLLEPSGSPESLFQSPRVAAQFQLELPKEWELGARTALRAASRCKTADYVSFLVSFF